MDWMCDWVRDHLPAGIPPDAEVTITSDDIGSMRIVIGWRAPTDGRPNRRALPISIHVDRDTASDFLQAATSDPGLREGFGRNFQTLLHEEMVRRGYAEADPDGGGAFKVDMGVGRLTDRN